VDEVNRDGKKAVKFAYEASVCGGIPIIHTLQSGFKGDIINEVMGICNGTTNYMLGKMEEVRMLSVARFKVTFCGSSVVF
jgi:homoserine dehydrogenase